jgi:hypothetical protein
MQGNKVFIVGCGRTGSTLLREILNKSEQVCIGPETHFLRRFSRLGVKKKLRDFGDLADDGNVERLLDYLYSKEVRALGTWGWFGKYVDRADFTRRLLASDRSERALFSLIMQTYAKVTKGGSAEGLILGDKTPTHLYYVPTLMEWFPGAKIIHTFRDPRGIIVSKLKKVEKGLEGPQVRFASLPWWLLDPLIAPIEVAHISKFWFDAVRLHAKYEQMYPQQYYLLRFEDMVSDPGKQIRQLCRFLNIEFDPAMLEEVIQVGSSYQAERLGPSGIDQKAADRWREHINPLVKLWFSVSGRKQLKKFGYTP